MVMPRCGGFAQFAEGNVLTGQVDVQGAADDVKGSDEIRVR